MVASVFSLDARSSSESRGGSCFNIQHCPVHFVSVLQYFWICGSILHSKVSRPDILQNKIGFHVEVGCRKILNGLNFYTVGFVPAWICSYLAVQVERPSRRPLLAVYCGNVATESLIEAGKKWGLWPRFKHGEVFTFAVVSALLMVIYKGLEFKDAIAKVLFILNTSGHMKKTGFVL